MKSSPSVNTLAIASIIISSGCGGLSLGPTAPVTADAAATSFDSAAVSSPTPPITYSSKTPTFLGLEDSELVRVFTAPREGGKCDETKAKPVLAGIDRTKLTFTQKVTTTVDSKVVTQEVAANVSALTFLEAQLNAKSVASVEMTQTNQAVVEDAALNTALGVLQEAHKDECLWVVVRYAAQYFAAKFFTEDKAEAGGGAFGVNAGGTYFAGGEATTRHYRWFFTIMKVHVGPPPPNGPEVAGVVARLSVPSKSELSALQQVYAAEDSAR